MLLMSLLLMLGLDVTHLYTKDISCFDISEVTFNNVYLERDVLGVTESPSLMDCIGFCYLHPCCRSVGFEPQSLECHLHKHNSSHSPRDHVSSPGWLHTDMASWSQNLFEVGSGTCGTLRLCPRNATCAIENKRHMTPDCPATLPHVINAGVTNGSRSVGSVRTYTCRRGYLDTASELTTAQTTCLQNSSWSFTSLICSGPWARVRTPSTRRPKMVWLKQSLLRHITIADSMVFQVKTCNDANFSFKSGVAHFKHNPDIVIGGYNNTMSVIRLCDSRCHFEKDLLTCSHFRRFWISWKGLLVAVGKGTQVGRGEFLRCYLMKTMQFTRVGVSTYINNPGTWLFKKRR